MGGFPKFAWAVTRISGHLMAFGMAIGIIIAWALTGPLFLLSNTWLLTLDTIVNIFTFSMIFLIRHAHNWESKTMQLKLAELIHTTKEGTSFSGYQKIVGERAGPNQRRFRTAGLKSGSGHKREADRFTQWRDSPGYGDHSVPHRGRLG